MREKLYTDVGMSYNLFTMARTVKEILDEMCVNLEYRFGSREDSLNLQPRPDALKRVMELVREARALEVNTEAGIS
jgi:hypothetical protein